MYKLTIRYGFLNYQLVTKQTFERFDQAKYYARDAIRRGFMAIITQVEREAVEQGRVAA